MTQRAQTIFRAKKNADNPFVMIDRRTIENPALSWKAKGLLAYLLSRPDDWVVRFGDLVKRAPDGAASVRAAVKELREAGHVKVISEREGGKVVRWVYEVHESPDCDFQQVENLQVENLQVENRTLNNKDSITILSNTNTEGGEEPASPLSEKDLAPPSDFWEKELSPTQELTRVPFGEEFEEPKRKIPPSQTKPMQKALARVMGYDLKIGSNYSRTGRLAKELLRADYTPEQIESIYGPGGSWFREDWRGKKGELPNMASIAQTVGMLAQGKSLSKREDAKARYEGRMQRLVNGN